MPAPSRETAPCFAANRRLLAEVQPWCPVPDDDGSIAWRDGAWRVQTAAGSLQLHGRSPVREAELLVAAVLDERPAADWLVMVGLGLGYLLDALEQRQWTGRVLAIEPEAQIVRAWLGRRDWRTWLDSGRLRLLVGPDYHGMSECRVCAGDGATEPAWLVSPVASRVDPEARARAAALVDRLRFDARANHQARRVHGARYLLNTLGNVGVLARAADVRRLADCVRGIPAIVVGAGPSLDLVLPALREARDRAVIVAVDTALRPLLGAGIEPHLVVAVDPGEANLRHLVDLPPHAHVHLVAEGSVDRQAWTPFTGRAFAFNVADHHPWPWLRSIGFTPGRLRAWGSVLTTAFDLACVTGADPVVFVGSDLAFTGTRPYARGVSYEEDWRRLAEWGVAREEQWTQQIGAWPMVEAADLDGRPTRSAAHLVAFRNWLVEQAGRQRGRTVINATGGGILHGAGVARRSLDDLLRDWPARPDLDDRIARAHRGETAPPSLAPVRSLAATLRAAANGRALDGDTADLVAAWTGFADGMTPARIEQALRDGLDAAPAAAAPPASTHGVAEPAYDAEWMAPLVREMPFVPLTMRPWQMDRVSAGVRRFRCRTAAGRLAGCALRVRDGAVAEDGAPLAQASWIDTVGPGQYFIWRDEVFFGSSDGTDPRENGRRYTVLVPAFVAYLESQPGDEILRQGL